LELIVTQVQIPFLNYLSQGLQELITKPAESNPHTVSSRPVSILSYLWGIE
jgi:hypothetical protein